jgi:hypothetical protein
MGGSFVKGCVVGAVCMLVGGVSTLALAGSGIGGVFNLGVSNSVDAQTKLTGSTAGSAQLLVNNTSSASGSNGLRAINASASAALKGENSSTGPGVFGTSTNGLGVQAQSAGAGSAALQAQNTAGGPAGSFLVNSGVAPFKVNSATKVTNLNADTVDGLDSTALKGPPGPPGQPGAPGPNPALPINFSIAVGDSDTIVTIGSWLSMNAFCPAPGDQTNYGFITGPGSPVTMFADGGSPDPTLLVIPPNSSAGSSFWSFNPDTDGFTFSASDNTHTATIFVFNHKHTNPFTHVTFCDFQGDVVAT